MAIRRNLAWMSLSQAALFLLQFGVSIVLAKLLTPYEMGIFAVATAIVALLSTLRGLGLVGYLIRAHDVTPALKASAFTVNAALALLVALLILGLSTLGGRLLAEPGVQHVLALLALTPLVQALEFLPAALLEREGAFSRIAAVNIARALLANAVTLGFAFAGASYMSLAYGQLAGTALGTLLFNAIGWRHAALRLGLHDWRALTAYGGQMLAISGVNVAATRLAELAMGRLLGLDALGLYSRASSLTAQLWDALHLLVARVVFVDFSDQKRQGRSLRWSYLRIVALLTGLLWPAFLGLAVVAGPVVQLLYGPVWIAAATPLALLCVAAALLVAITMTWEVFVVSGETARQARFEVVRATAGFALFALACLVGIAAAAAARIGEALFAVALYRPHLDRMTETSARDLLPIYGASALPTAAALAPAALVMLAHGWSPDTPLARLALAILAGVVLWALTLAFTGHPLYTEARTLLGRLRPRLRPTRPTRPSREEG